MPAVATTLAGISSNKISVFIEFQKVPPRQWQMYIFLGLLVPIFFSLCFTPYTSLAEWYLWGFLRCNISRIFLERFKIQFTFHRVVVGRVSSIFSAFASNSLSVYYVYKALLLIFHISPPYIHLLRRKRAHEAFQQLFRVLWCFCVPLWSSHIKNCVTHNNSSCGRRGE